MKGMAHDVNAGLGPVMEFSLMPELFCLGKVGVVKHTHSFINPELFIKTADIDIFFAHMS
jgi:hypothetical protein